MEIELGHLSAIFRYPIKSMAGTRLNSAKIGWHGVEGDRRLAFRRLADRGAVPPLRKFQESRTKFQRRIRIGCWNLVLDSWFLLPELEYSLTDEALRDSLLASPAISVTMRDKRCVMINLDPDTAEANADVIKTVIRMNENHAGVYGTVVRTGELRVGQAVGLRA